MTAEPLTLRAAGVGRSGQPWKFRLSRGEQVSLRGGNGCGKTTLLKSLAGLATTAGLPPLQRWLNDRPLIGHDPEYQGLLHYVGHRPGLGHGMTIAGDWTFWSGYLAAEPHTPTPDFNAIADRLALNIPLDIPLDQLSAGQSQKVALARLWLQPRPIWLLDEPDAHLDRHTISLLHQELIRHRETGGLVIETSHRTDFNSIIVNLE